jgi:hypothetical protein
VLVAARFLRRAVSVLTLTPRIDRSSIARQLVRKAYADR